MRRLIFSLHGIRTRGAWQKTKLSSALGNADFRHVPLDYGSFSLLKFLWPRARREQINWLRQVYAEETHNELERPSIIAHSLGTYLVTEAIRLYPEVRFDSVILCGSIVRRDYPWSRVVEDGAVRRVLNDRGRRDLWARLVIWFLEDAGPSGTEGFLDSAGGAVVEREHPEWRHSDFFNDQNYQDSWIPFLADRPLARLPIAAPPTWNWRFWAIVCCLVVLLVVSGAMVYKAQSCHETIIDMTAQNDTTYALVAQRLDEPIWRDPQEGRFFNCVLWLYVVQPSGEVDQGRLATLHLSFYPDPPQGAIALAGDHVLAFISYKPENNQFNMSGVVYLMDQVTAQAESAFPIFEAPDEQANPITNGGWFPYFEDANLITFNFDGYQRLETRLDFQHLPLKTTSVPVRPVEARQKHANWVAKHSNGKLPTRHDCFLLWKLRHPSVASWL